jgi:tetratricopeptide (TPR) repeat protein
VKRKFRGDARSIEGGAHLSASKARPRPALTSVASSAKLREMAKTAKAKQKHKTGHTSGGASASKSLKNKNVKPVAAHAQAVKQAVDPLFEQQLKIYEQAVQLFHQQKYVKVKELLVKVISGPSKELADRAQVHMRITDQRMAKQAAPAMHTPEDFYQAGVAMMNLGRWDDAREHLLRARKLAPKADFVFYAMAALDCLTGETESAMQNLKTAIQLRPENRYHARNDEDFAFLQEDPRFTELLYPERESSGG